MASHYEFWFAWKDFRPDTELYQVAVGSPTVVDLLYIGAGLFVLVDVVPLVGDPLLAEELLAPLAIGAPGGSVHLYGLLLHETRTSFFRVSNPMCKFSHVTPSASSGQALSGSEGSGGEGVPW